MDKHKVFTAKLKRLINRHQVSKSPDHFVLPHVSSKYILAPQPPHPFASPKPTSFAHDLYHPQYVPFDIYTLAFSRLSRNLRKRSLNVAP